MALAVLKLRNPSVSASPVLASKACTTMARLTHIFFLKLIQIGLKGSIVKDYGYHPHRHKRRHINKNKTHRLERWLSG